MRNFPEIRAAELSVEDAGLGLDIAKTARMPRLFASYSFGSVFWKQKAACGGIRSWSLLSLEKLRAVKLFIMLS